jgi:membrane-bound lytic murein transglycosylase A
MLIAKITRMLLLGTLLAACRTTAPSPELVAIPWDEAPPLVDDGDPASFLTALRETRAWLSRRPQGAMQSVNGYTFPSAALDGALAQVEEHVAAHGLDAQLRPLLRRLFDVYETKTAGEQAPVLATGYYVPMIEGSLAPHPSYPVPVYGVPTDLVTLSLAEFDSTLPARQLRGRLVGQKLVPYHDRQEIRSRGVLAGTAPVLAWVKDEVDLFVVEVQGSGIVREPSGATRVIGYAAENGRPYRAVGKLLLEEQKIPKERMSMQAIRAYLREHPREVPRILAYNQSFVFFRLADDGAVLGNLGRPLTPRRSVATDHRIMPSGALGFLSVERPAVDATGHIDAKGRIERFVFNQDTGGAIRGAGRVDFFWGAGDEAEHMAGLMQHRGRLLFLVPKANQQAEQPISPRPSP